MARGSSVAIAAGAAVPGVRRRSGLATTGVVAWAVMAAAQIVIPLTDRRAGPTVVVVVAATVSAWAWAASVWGVKRAGQVLAWVVGSTLLIEWVGTTTGFPFGAYRYTDALQPQVAGVPLIVPLAWFAVGVPALAVAGSITGARVGSESESGGGGVRAGHSGGRIARHAGWAARPTGGARPASTAGRWIVAALALTAWDLFLDPQMVDEGYWVWTGDGAYRGIPLTNYLGWFVSALLVLAVADHIGSRAGPTADTMTGQARLAAAASWRSGPDRAAAATSAGPMRLPVAVQHATGTTRAAGPHESPRPTLARSLPLLGLYTWWAVMESVGFLVFFGDPLVGVVGGVAMGVPTALVWRGLLPQWRRAGRRDGDQSGSAACCGDDAARFRRETGEPPAPVAHG